MLVCVTTARVDRRHWRGGLDRNRDIRLVEGREHAHVRPIETTRTALPTTTTMAIRIARSRSVELANEAGEEPTLEPTVLRFELPSH